MNPLVYIVLGMVGLGALVMAFVPSLLGSSRADKRMKALQGDIQANRRETSAARSRDERRKQIAQTLRQQNETPGKAKGHGPLQVWLGHKRKRHQNAYLDELPNAVEAIVRGVKSGLPLNDSMRLVAKEAKEPIKSEFQRVLDQQALGKSTTEAVQMLFDRMPLPEVNFFVVVITVQQQAGGNLSEALGNLSRVLRNRKKMKQKIKAMSSEAKASAGIIGSLPFIVGILVTLTTPAYMVPLFSTTTGQIWLGIAAVLMGIGVFMMNRMIQFDF